MAGNCDSGYSCVYSSTMSWRSATQPLPKEVNPKLVFERLFGAGRTPTAPSATPAARASSTSSARTPATSNAKLGATDQRKLDEYFSAVRDIEQRIERAAKLPEVEAARRGPSRPASRRQFDEHLRLMCDLMVLAFQADVTRVCTFVLRQRGQQPALPVHRRAARATTTCRTTATTPKKKAKIRDINTLPRHAARLPAGRS